VEDWDFEKNGLKIKVEFDEVFIFLIQCYRILLQILLRIHPEKWKEETDRRSSKRRKGRFQSSVGWSSQKKRLGWDEGCKCIRGVGREWGRADCRDKKSAMLRRGVEQRGRKRMWGSQERKEESRKKQRRIRDVSGSCLA
jgi:hypothetical protein